MLPNQFKGILFALLIGGLSYFLADYIPFLNAVLLSFLVGIIIGNLTVLPTSLSSGIQFSATKMLELSIVLMAFGISYGKIASIGSSKFILIAILLVAIMIVTVLLAKIFKGTPATTWLVGFGTAICGSSAIAALAPSVSDKPEDTGISIAIVSLLGSLGMVLMPLALTYFNATNEDCSFFIGAGLHSVGNVAGAGFGMSQEIGSSAVTLKLARVALLSPSIIFFKMLVRQNDGKGWKNYFKLPMYLWAFIAISILVSVIPFPVKFLDILEQISKLFLVVSMAGIGLKVSLRQLFDSGQHAMKFGLVIFAIQLVLISILLHFS